MSDIQAYLDHALADDQHALSKFCQALGLTHQQCGRLSVICHRHWSSAARGLSIDVLLSELRDLGLGDSAVEYVRSRVDVMWVVSYLSAPGCRSVAPTIDTDRERAQAAADAWTVQSKARVYRLINVRS